MQLRGRENERLARVALAEVTHCKILQCKFCDWKDVSNASRNASSVIGAHNRNCAGKHSHGSREHVISFDNHYDGLEGDESDGEQGEIVVGQEDHENFRVLVVELPSGKSSKEKSDHRRRMEVLEPLIISHRREVDRATDGICSGEEHGEVSLSDEEPAVEGEEAEGPDASEMKKRASCRVLNHQTHVESILSNPLPDMRGGKDSSSNIALHDLGMTLGLSRRQGNLVLQFLQEHGKGSFYECWDGLRSAFDKQFKDTHVLHRLDISLPVEFFGEKDIGGAPLKKTSCEYYPILLRIGDAFLEINPEDFTSTFSGPDLVRDTNERIYNTFPKAKLFQRFCTWTKRTHGSSAIPVIIAVYFDEAEATSSRSACPLIMFILNCSGESFRPIFLGYCPLKLPYSDDYLRKLLHMRGVGGKFPSKKSCEYAIRYAKRQALQRFIVHVLQPVLDCKEGLILQLGNRSRRNNSTIFAVPHLGNFIGDSAALHDIGSVAMNGKKCRCRQCTCSNLAAFGPNALTFSTRDSTDMYALACQLGVYELHKFEKSCGIQVPKLSREDRERKRVITDIGKKMSVIPGANEVILLWECYEKAAVFCFFVALCIDYLHTVWKGILENAASWVLQTIYCSSNFTAELGLAARYKDGMALLDQRLAAWAGLKESLQPVPLVSLERVSELLKTESRTNKSKNRTTGLMTGGFPAWQMRNLVLQLIFGIGCEGTVIPNCDVIISDHIDTRHGNPTIICLNALVAVLEVAFFCEANELRESQLETMMYVIQNAACHLLPLYDLKRKWCLQTGITKLKAKKVVRQYEVPQNFKTHATCHLPDQIRMFGAESKSYNAAIGEKYHQVAVSGAMKRTSGVLETTQQEMAAHVLRKQMSRMQSVYGIPMVDRSGRVDGEEEPEELLELQQESSFQQFHAVLTLGSCQLIPYEDDSMLGSKGGVDIDYLHSLLETCELYSLISGICATSPYCKEVFQGWMSAKGSANHRVCLFGAVKSDGSKDAGLEPWYLRANKRYHGNSRGEKAKQGFPVFNSFEIDYSTADGEEGGPNFAKVLALVGFQKRSKDSTDKWKTQTQIYVAVARYEHVVKPRGVSFPFEQFKFEIKHRRLSLDFVSLESVKRPTFMCISCDAAANDKFENKHNYSRMLWYCLPFHTAVKVENVLIATRYDTMPDSARYEHMTAVLEEFGLDGINDEKLSTREVQAIHQCSSESGSDSDISEDGSSSSDESDDDMIVTGK